eukprot:9744085-Ditylum_brightwellii.AAC.1
MRNNNQKKPAAPKSNKSNTSNKKGIKSKKQDPYTWKKIPSKDTKAHQKQVKHPKSDILETYYWCPAHNVWTKHNLDPNHPDGCKKAKQQQQARAAGHPSSWQSNSMRAMAAVFDAATWSIIMIVVCPSILEESNTIVIAMYKEGPNTQDCANTTTLQAERAGWPKS